MPKLAKFRKKIDSAEKILLITHQNPDGDALGSIIAFSFILQALKKNYRMVCSDKIPSLFSFLPQIPKLEKDFLIGDFDLVIVLDCGDLKRTGFAQRLKLLKDKKMKIINIDHHPKNDVHKISYLNIVDYQVSSTAEIIYHLIKNWQIKIDRDIATCLLCGIFTDTGAFQHSNTTSEVLKITSELLSQGARLKQITSNITNGKTLSALKLWGLVLSRVRRQPDLGLVTSVITKKDIINCQANTADLAGVVNLINTIPQSNAAILFSETEDGKIKASLRTEKNNIDVSRIAQIFGGGGLKKASGFTIEGKIIKDRNGGWKIKNCKI